MSNFRRHGPERDDDKGALPVSMSIANEKKVHKSPSPTKVRGGSSNVAERIGETTASTRLSHVSPAGRDAPIAPVSTTRVGAVAVPGFDESSSTASLSYRAAMVGSERVHNSSEHVDIRGGPSIYSARLVDPAREEERIRVRVEAQMRQDIEHEVRQEVQASAPVATLVDTNEDKCKGRCLLISVLIVVIVLGVAVGVAIPLSRREGEPPPVSDGNEENSTSVPEENSTSVAVDALIVGGEITIFDDQGRPDIGSGFSTHFASFFLDGPTALMRQVESQCTTFYAEGIGLRQAALCGSYNGDQELTVEDFECIGSELVKAIDSDNGISTCNDVVFPNYTDMTELWNVASDDARSNIDQRIQVYTTMAQYVGCSGNIQDGTYETLVGINKADGVEEKRWFITRVGRSYYVERLNGASGYSSISPNSDVIIFGAFDLEIQTDIEIVHLLVKTMIDTGVVVYADLLVSLRESWFTNRGMAFDLTNHIKRTIGTPILFLGEDGEILYPDDRQQIEFEDPSCRFQ